MWKSLAPLLRSPTLVHHASRGKISLARQERFLRARHFTRGAFSSSSVSLPNSSTQTSAVVTLSTTAAPIASQQQESSSVASKTPKDDSNKSNVFIDNIGTLFLSAIGLIVASLIRSYYGNQNRHAVRDAVEESSSLDPLEIVDLRSTNPHLTVPVFRTLMKRLHEHVQGENPGQATKPILMTYEQFVTQIRRFLRDELQTPAATIELGHLLDRVVLSMHQSQQWPSSGEPRDVRLWWTVLTLVLASTVAERQMILYEIMDGASPADVQAMIGWLQDTNQLPADCQVFPNTQQYPVQNYHHGRVADHIQTDDTTTLEQWNALLRSKTVCAWGECYHKKWLV